MKKQFKLIDSTYPAEEAKEVILSLVNDKINFLQKKIFSHEIRFELDTPHLKQRVTELKQEVQELKEILNKLDNDQLIEINCSVKLQTTIPVEE